MKFTSIAVIVGAAVCTLVMSGCAGVATPYSPSIANVSTLKANGNEPISIGAFTVQASLATATTLMVRASPMTSPVGKDYAAYVSDALRKEVELASRLNPGSKLEISGVLVGNEIDAAIVKGTAAIQVQFVVRRDGVVRFDKVKRGAIEWESSFAGAVAIPKAGQSYPLVVQALLTSLYADPDFLAALR